MSRRPHHGEYSGVTLVYIGSRSLVKSGLLARFFRTKDHN